MVVKLSQEESRNLAHVKAKEKAEKYATKVFRVIAAIGVLAIASNFFLPEFRGLHLWEIADLGVWFPAIYGVIAIFIGLLIANYERKIVYQKNYELELQRIKSQKVTSQDAS